MTEHKNRDFYRWTRDKQKAFEEQVQRANDSKFPSSGGTITGPVKIELPAQQNNPERVLEFSVKYKTDSQPYKWAVSVMTVGPMIYLEYAGRSLVSISPSLGIVPISRESSFSLGYSSSPWPNVYTKKLNNGADLELPTKAGTIALLSDIEDILKKYNLIPETKE